MTDDVPAKLTAKDPLSDRAGRPSFKPTADDRRYVAGMFGVGMSVEQVCKVIGITRPTLHKHFPSEINFGRDLSIAAVKQALYRKATSVKITSASVKAAELFLKMAGEFKGDGGDIGKKQAREIEARQTPDGEWADLDQKSH